MQRLSCSPFTAAAVTKQPTSHDMPVTHAVSSISSKIVELSEELHVVGNNVKGLQNAVDQVRETFMGLAVAMRRPNRNIYVQFTGKS